METCYECGRSVKWGSGNFVNRILSLDTENVRKEMNVPYPDGNYICAECDSLGWEEPTEFYLTLSEDERRERGIPDDYPSRTK